MRALRGQHREVAEPGRGATTPSIVELSLMAGGLALAALAFLVFTRFFPVVSLWEEAEGQETRARNAASRIRDYFPADEGAPARAVAAA